MPSRRAASARLPPASRSARPISRASSRATAVGRSPGQSVVRRPPAPPPARKSRSAAVAASAAAEHRHALHRVPQLAHVARPGVAQQQVLRRRRRAPAGAGRPRRGAGSARASGRMSSLPLAQRRQVDRDHVEPVVEVLRGSRRRAPRAARSRWVAATIRTSTRAPAGRRPACTVALLQGAQDLGLHGERHVADLVQEQRAARRVAEGAGALGRGAGEGAAGVAEQLALEQVGGDRGAVDRDERPARAPAVLVDGARHQLLAGAGLAGDQHGGVAVGDEADHLLHPRIAGLEPIRVSASASGAAGRAAGGAGGAQHPADEVGHLLAPDRLGQVVEGAQPHRLDRVGGAGVGGEDRDRRRATAARGRGAAPRARPSRPACGGRAAPRRRRPRPRAGPAPPARPRPRGRRGRGRPGSRPAPRAGPRRRRRSGFAPWQLQDEGGAVRPVRPRARSRRGPAPPRARSRGRGPCPPAGR